MEAVGARETAPVIPLSAFRGGHVDKSVVRSGGGRFIVRLCGGVLLVVSLVVLGGCGPVLATPEMAQAARAVETAEDAEADRFAVYEYTLAVSYLDKAREEWGHARYRKAYAYAERARVYAEEAARRAERSPSRGTSDLDRRLP